MGRIGFAIVAALFLSSAVCLWWLRRVRRRLLELEALEAKLAEYEARLRRVSEG